MELSYIYLWFYLGLCSVKKSLRQKEFASLASTVLGAWQDILATAVMTSRQDNDTNTTQEMFLS